MSTRKPAPLPEAAAYLGPGSVRTFRRVVASHAPVVQVTAGTVRYPTVGLDLYRASRLRGAPTEKAVVDGRCSQDWRKLFPSLFSDASPGPEPAITSDRGKPVM